MKLNCPRCNSERIIDYEDIIECLDCNLEFEKKDFELIEDKSNILAIQEKKAIVHELKNSINLEKKENE